MRANDLLHSYIHCTGRFSTKTEAFNSMQLRSYLFDILAKEKLVFVERFLDLTVATALGEKCEDDAFRACSLLLSICRSVYRDNLVIHLEKIEFKFNNKKCIENWIYSIDNNGDNFSTDDWHYGLILLNILISMNSSKIKCTIDYILNQNIMEHFRHGINVALSFD